MGSLQLFWIAVAVLCGMFVIYLVLMFNALVSVKNNVARAWANIDVLLKQRHDELPRLVEVCRQYKQFEQETLLRVTQARQQVSAAREARNIAALGPAEAELRAGTARVFAIAEAYPALKANDNFMQLQQRITGLENAIADRREFYNDSVNVNNTRIAQFPDVIVARLFGFGEARLLNFDAGERRPVDMKSLLAT
jgi:LemA protein